MNLNNEDNDNAVEESVENLTGEAGVYLAENQKLYEHITNLYHGFLEPLSSFNKWVTFKS